MSSPAEARLAVKRALRDHPEALAPERIDVSPVENGWLVHGDGLELKVDPTGALTGSVRVDPLAARARLFSLTFFAIASAWYAGSLFAFAALLIVVPLQLLGGARVIDRTIVTGLMLVLTAWLALRFMKWVATLRPELLDEPIATVAEGVKRWPAPPGVDELLRRSGLLMVPALVAGLLSASIASQTGSTLGCTLMLLSLVPVVGVMIEARGVPAVQSGTPPRPLPTGGSWNEFVTTGLLGSRLVLGVALFGIAARASGLVTELATVTSTRVPMWSEVFDTGLQLAVIIAVLASKSSAGRRAAAIALFAGLLGERLAGQPGKVVVASLALFLTLRAAHRSTTREALRLTLQFELLVALGRIAGRLTAGLFLGPLSLGLGEALGEQFTALSVSSRLEPLEVGPRAPLGVSPHFVGAAAGALIGLTVLLIVGPWRTSSREAPSDWKTVEGLGWSARMPGTPARQSVRARLSADGPTVPLHHFTSFWKGSLFTVFEVEWPRERSELDLDGLLTTSQLLPFQFVNGCEGLIVGVTRENSVRCLASPSAQRLTVGCVLSDPLGGRLVDGELAFLANLKAGDVGFEAGKRGLQPDRCVFDPAFLREAQRRLDLVR